MTICLTSPAALVECAGIAGRREGGAEKEAGRRWNAAIAYPTRSGSALMMVKIMAPNRPSLGDARRPIGSRSAPGNRET